MSSDKYAMRHSNGKRDEPDILISFNEMLRQIQQREEALQQLTMS